MLLCQIRINDKGGASRQKQLLQRAHGQHWRSPLMVFWCQYIDIISRNVCLLFWFNKIFLWSFSKPINQSLRQCWTFQIFYISVGEFSKWKFSAEMCNKKVIDWIWQNMPANGLGAEANLASSVSCTTQRPGAGIFCHFQSITYN